jgi:hypothetical protein
MDTEFTLRKDTIQGGGMNIGKAIIDCIIIIDKNLKHGVTLTSGEHKI